MCIGISFIGFLFELANKYRYQLFKKRIINDTALKKAKAHIFGDIYKNLTDRYSKFITKHIINDNFLQIFKIYYPDCKMNQKRINCVIYKYLYDLDVPLLTEDYLRSTPHITIKNDFVNDLTDRFVNQYIMTDNNLTPSLPGVTFGRPPDDISLIDPTDLSDISDNKSFISIVYNHLKYLVFCFKMYRKGYVKHDIGPWMYSNIRLWINNSVSDNVNANNIKNCIIIDKTIEPTGGDRNDRSDDDIYIEIKGFTKYSELFDAITMDLFNTYPKIIDITKQFGVMMDRLSKNTKINIHAQNISTIIIPFLVNYYEERIEKIIVVNPIYYPYSYTMLFDVIHKTDAKNKLKFDLNPNLLMLLNRLALIDIYFDFIKIDKLVNKLYRNCVDIKFNKNLYENICIDADNLTMLMGMYSECVVKNIELNTY